jgi:hypothetical protein
VAPALAAVAGTLTHLELHKFQRWLGLNAYEVDVAYELGVAVGKLRRLKDLTLSLCVDARFYRAFAQGLAASGSDYPLPLLWRVMPMPTWWRACCSRVCVISSRTTPAEQPS